MLSHVNKNSRGFVLKALWHPLDMDNPTGWNARLVSLFYRPYKLELDEQTGELRLNMAETRANADLPIFLRDPETGELLKGDRSQGYYKVTPGSAREPYNFMQQPSR